MEEQKEETPEPCPEPQSKLHIEESKIVKEKHERSLKRNEKRIHTVICGSNLHTVFAVITANYCKLLANYCKLLTNYWQITAN